MRSIRLLGSQLSTVSNSNAGSAASSSSSSSSSVSGFGPIVPLGSLRSNRLVNTCETDKPVTTVNTLAVPNEQLSWRS